MAGESASKRASFTSLLCVVLHSIKSFLLSIRSILFFFSLFIFNFFFLLLNFVSLYFIYLISFFFFCCWFVRKLWILRLTRWDSGLVKETTVPWSRPALIVAADFLTHVAWGVQLHVFGPDFQPRPRGREATTLRIEL